MGDGKEGDIFLGLDHRSIPVGVEPYVKPDLRDSLLVGFF
jgi:hypothetical protein